MSESHPEAPAAIDPADAAPSTPDSGQVLRVESQALYLGLLAGAAGALVGLIIGLTLPNLPLFGTSSLGAVAALASGIAVGVTATIGHRRTGDLPIHEWRRDLSSVRSAVDAVAVVTVHTVLAILSVLAAFYLLSASFRGLRTDTFWTTSLLGVAVGLSAYFCYLSVSRVTTQKMTSLLLTFVVIGTVTAMVTAPDERWWETHFSHLGTFFHVSGLMFNGTLVVAGLLVTTFAVYLAHDMRGLLAEGALKSQVGPGIFSWMFIIMGIMLAGVGAVTVDLSNLVHNLCAFGLAVMYLGMLVLGPWILRGMPRAYFIASAIFLVATIATIVLFATGYFSLTAFEILVFALVFGWISVFMRFLGVAGETE